MDNINFIMEPLTAVFSMILAYVPTVVYMAVALIVGGVLARTVSKHASVILKRVGVDKLTHAIGLTDVLIKGGVKSSPADIIAKVFSWGIVITTLVIVLGMIGVGVLSTLLDPVKTYVPVVLHAVLGLMIAMFVAYYVAIIVRIIAANTDMPRPELLATLTKWAIIVHAFYGFIHTIGLGVLFTGTPMIIMVAGLALALGLAFGIGGRDHATKYLDKVLKH